ncbi:MAG: phosphatase PAP2 family protein [Gemmatimonadetes bacterium]|nr:phosphatase PAP2 family protein [Gemmatimonadota bacterium]
MTQARLSLWQRLDARDRALFVRWVISELTPVRSTRLWRALTHLGGLRCSVAGVLLPLLMTGGALRAAAREALIALVVSHLVVQVVKRSVMRRRPTDVERAGAYVEVPDCFSFPSGHACASMSVAFAYGLRFPTLAVPLVALASIVGFSRVRLGVHYPGDVIVGQAIAILTVAVLGSAA